jgi:hydrogenase maturation protease
VRVIAVGNAWRGDDAVGLAVAQRLRGRLPADVELLEREEEPTGLIDAWRGAEAIWLIDALSHAGEAGAVHRFDATEEPLPIEAFRRHSTHAIDVAQAIELARALGELPPHVVVYGIEGVNFAAGAKLTNELEAAADEVANAIIEEVDRCTSGR